MVTTCSCSSKVTLEVAYTKGGGDRPTHTNREHTTVVQQKEGKRNDKHTKTSRCYTPSCWFPLCVCVCVVFFFLRRFQQDFSHITTVADWCLIAIGCLNAANTYDVSVCVIGILRRFQKSFSHITTVAASCMRRESAWGLVPQTQDTNTPHSHIILTPGQPVLMLSSFCWEGSEETNNTHCSAFGLWRPGPEPATSRLGGERSINLATQPV